MKKLYLFAALAAMLAACSENDLTAEKQVVQQNAEEGAVLFDAYVNRGSTRAGKNGVIDNETTGLKDTKANGGGFGVFGYYTNGESYTGSSRPDFFYNQGVFWETTPGRFTYTPLKYWPNEFGNDAISDQVDKVSLFAYAPYVEVEPLTGLVTADAPDNAINITGMTRNNATGDPLVKYTSSMISNNSVDLCYGVAKNNFTSSNSSYNPNKITAGKPYIDVVKPGTDANSKIFFDFKHALAQLNVTIDAKVVDLTSSPAQTNGIQTDYTRIWVRSITFEGITQTGALNLNSPGSSPNWYDVNGTSLLTTGSLTVYDGRKDGREANEAANSESPATLNPTIVQSEPYNATGAFEKPAVLGVTTTTKNLFAKWNDEDKKYEDATATTDPIFVIPTNEKMKVTIVYDVETADENLASYLSDGSRRGSTIENRIYKTIDAFGNIQAGKKYTLNLHLGMRTVDFDAWVTAWDNYGSDIDLPSNLPAFTAGAPAYNIYLPAGTDNYDYEFAINGLDPNEAVTFSTSTATSWITTTATQNSANGAGIAKQKITIVKNTETVNRNNTAQHVWEGSTSGKKAWLDITQLAAPFDCTLSTYATKVFTFAWTVTNVTYMSDIDDIKVYKNGILQTVTTDYTVADDAKTITLVNTPADGDIFEFQLKDGNAATVTIVKKIE